MTAGANGLAAFNGDISFKGSLAAVDGRIKLSAQKSRLGRLTRSGRISTPPITLV